MKNTIRFVYRHTDGKRHTAHLYFDSKGIIHDTTTLAEQWKGKNIIDVLNHVFAQENGVMLGSGFTLDCSGIFTVESANKYIHEERETFWNEH